MKKIIATPQLACLESEETKQVKIETEKISSILQPFQTDFEKKIKKLINMLGNAFTQCQTNPKEKHKIKAILNYIKRIDKKNEFKFKTLVLHIVVKEMESKLKSEVTQYLIDFGIDINQQDSQGMTPIYILSSADENHINTFRTLIDAGADVETPNLIDGGKLIHIIAQNGHVEQMRYLLEQRPDVDLNERIPKSRSPFELAILHSNSKICRLLVEDFGIDINQQDSQGMTPIYILSSADKIHVNTVNTFRTLIDNGADVEIPNFIDGAKLIHVLAQNGHVEQMRYLLEQRPDVDLNERMPNTRSPLELAALRSNTKMCRLLVQKGVAIKINPLLKHHIDPEIFKYLEGAKLWTPIHRACDALDPDLVLRCLKLGFDPNHEVDSDNPKMRTPKSIIKAHPDSEAKTQCLELLEIASKPWNFRNPDVYPLMSDLDLRVAQRLEDYKVKGKYPFHFAGSYPEGNDVWKDYIKPLLLPFKIGEFVQFKIKQNPDTTSLTSSQFMGLMLPDQGNIIKHNPKDRTYTVKTHTGKIKTGSFSELHQPLKTVIIQGLTNEKHKDLNGLQAEWKRYIYHKNRFKVIITSKGAYEGKEISIKFHNLKFLTPDEIITLKKSTN